MDIMDTLLIHSYFIKCQSTPILDTLLFKAFTHFTLPIGTSLTLSKLSCFWSGTINNCQLIVFQSLENYYILTKLNPSMILLNEDTVTIKFPHLNLIISTHSNDDSITQDLSTSIKTLLDCFKNSSTMDLHHICIESNQCLRYPQIDHISLSEQDLNWTNLMDTVYQFKSNIKNPIEAHKNILEMSNLLLNSKKSILEQDLIKPNEIDELKTQMGLILNRQIDMDQIDQVEDRMYKMIHRQIVQSLLTSD
ncbi:hypothetical protein BC833DRAFT_585647 [Globomyces pollinis-pini]|nr:hypothetical protein BC833DRAFT_585647 [Globomyces pollinis-pini]